MINTLQSQLIQLYTDIISNHMKLGYQICMSELLYGRHHERVDHYDISISHISSIDLFPHTWIFRFHLPPRIRILFMSNGDYLLSASTRVNPGFMLLFSFLVFCVLFFVLFVFVMCRVANVARASGLSIGPSVFSNVFIITSGTLQLKTKHLSCKINPKCLNI